MALSILEAFTVISITQLSMVVYSRILPENPFLEFLLFSVPQYLVFRYLKYAYLIYTVLFMALLVFPKKRQHAYSKHTCPIDRLRMLIISLVSLAIYSANFKFYDSDRYGKSMEYGLLLMDIGVGSFVYNAGLVSCKMSTRKKLINALKCLVFGAGRQMSIILMGLSVKDAEFGHHLNFFYILAILNLISIFVRLEKNQAFFGCLLIFFHQILLQTFLEDMIFNNQRENMIMMNLEGISYIIPEFGIYLISQEIGKIFIERKNLNRIVKYNIGFIVIFAVSVFKFEISRRIHNIPFSLFVIILNTSQLIACEYLNNEHQLGFFRIAHFASKNMLFMLLFSNLLIPISKSLGIFEADNLIEIGLKTLGYLFIVYFVPYMVNRTYRKSTKSASVK